MASIPKILAITCHSFSFTNHQKIPPGNPDTGHDTPVRRYRNIAAPLKGKKTMAGRPDDIFGKMAW